MLRSGLNTEIFTVPFAVKPEPAIVIGSPTEYFVLSVDIMVVAVSAKTVEASLVVEIFGASGTAPVVVERFRDVSDNVPVSKL